MPINKFADPAGRINKMKGEILAHASMAEVMGKFGQQRSVPPNNGDTVIYRRWQVSATEENKWVVPSTTDATADFVNAHKGTEGVTPPAEKLIPKDYSCQLEEYEVLFGLSSKTAELYEDDVPSDMKMMVGERVALIREMVRWGQARATGSVAYAGGTSRATVTDKVTLNLLRREARALKANHAHFITKMLSPSPNIDTRPVEAAYIILGHTDLEPDFRAMGDSYTPVAKYGSREPLSEYEVGSVENFRIMLSPEFVPIQDAGGDPSANNLLSTSGSKADVYPILMFGEDAWGQVALRGQNALNPTYVDPRNRDSYNPLGKFGYVGARFYFDATVLNDGWLTLIEAGASAL